MSLVLIQKVVVKDYKNSLPIKIGKFTFIRPSIQKYYSKLQEQRQYLDLGEIELGIESDLKCEVLELRKIGTLLATLRLIKPNESVIRYMIADPNNRTSKTIILENKIFPAFLDDRIREKRIERRDFSILQEIWPKVESLYNKEYFSRVRNAIDFIEHSRWNWGFNDSLINLVTGLESIFTTESQELSYKIGLRGAWFIHPFKKDYDKRQNLYKDLRSMYSYRSAMLHGNDISKYKKDSTKYLQTAQYVLRAAIIKILRDEHGENLFQIFSTKGSKQLEEYFLKLTTGEFAFQK